MQSDTQHSETPAALCSMRLLADGWREYPDQIKKYARCFYKRFDTPTRCAGNDDKPGIQIQIAVSEHDGWMSMEMDLCAGLKDETWLAIKNYSLPKTVEEVTALIPRLLAMWESSNADLRQRRPTMTHDGTTTVEFPATSAAKNRGVFASKDLLGCVESDLAPIKAQLTALSAKYRDAE